MDTTGAELIGAQRPALWTAPPRHREKQPDCARCDDDDYTGGCGNHVAEEMLDWADNYWQLDDWQRWSLTEGLGVKPNRRFAATDWAEIVPRQNGKGCGSLSEVLYTTTRGWVTYGDIRVGDCVPDANGAPIEVVYVSPVFTGRPCYAVEFTDGAKVIVSEEHLWRVKRKDDTRGWRDVRTDVLARSVGRRRPGNGRMEYNWRVRCDAIPDLPEAELPVDPYLLGYWLGDGDSGAARMTVGSEDLSWSVGRFGRAGAVCSEPTFKGGASTAYAVRFRTAQARALNGFLARARTLGVLGDKHIPELYLTASIAQRKALLAGLMDSDGSVTRNNKTPQCEFSTSIPALADGFHRLARSLGIRVAPQWRTTKKRDNCRFLFTAPFNPFEMPRKAERWVLPDSKRHELMSIVAITPVPSVPVRCIKIANEDGVYLTGKYFTPTHNTILEVRELGGLYVLGERKVIHTAHIFGTAMEHFGRCCEIIENNNDLIKWVKGKPSRSHVDVSITLKAKPTRIFGAGSTQMTQSYERKIQFLARTGRSGRGFGCNCLVLDEDMYVTSEQLAAMRPTLRAFANHQILFMGSAGMPESVEEAALHDRIVDDEQTLFGAEWGGLVMHKPECPRDKVRGRRVNDYVVDCTLHDDRDDPQSWAKSNPGYGTRIEKETFEKELAAARDLVLFDRELLNVGQWPSREAAWTVVDKDQWEFLAIRTGAGTVPPVVWSVDVDEDGKTAAIAACWVNGKGKDARIVVSNPKGCVFQGTEDVIPRLREMTGEWGALAIAVPKDGPAAGIGDDVEKVYRDKVVRPGPGDQAAAFAFFTQKVKEGVIGHAPQDRAQAMYEALGSADTRMVGDGGKTLKRREAQAPVSPASTAILAAWLLNKKRRGYDPTKSVG